MQHPAVGSSNVRRVTTVRPHKPDGRYIGRCGLYPFRNQRNEIVPHEAFIACYLARPYWGRGLATEAATAWIAYGFETLGLRRIEAGMNAASVASRRVVEKLGFQWIRSRGDEHTRWHDFELWNPRARAWLDDESSST